MNAFRVIIQKFFNQDKIFLIDANNTREFCQYIYSSNYQNNTCNSLFYFYFFNLCENNESGPDMYENINKKFNCINAIISNIFVSESQKNEILEMFSKMQRVYYGFVKLAHLYKFKKAKVQVTTDLCMTDLNPKSSNVFILRQNNSKYYFSIKDLINMLNHNLSNCMDFAPDPIITKNPYNNLMLSNVELYNIYFFMRWNNCIIPELFQGYFMSNFNMKTFRFNYEFNIINTYIKNYIYTSHHDTLYPIFKSMCSDCKHITRKLRIDVEFPKEKLMNIMKPYLHLYYTWIHATNGTYKQCNAEYTLKRKLRLFINFNPKFGRKYCSIKRIMFNKRKLEYHFNDEHMNFYKENKPILINKQVLPRSRSLYVYEEDDNDDLDGENIAYGESVFFNFLNDHVGEVEQSNHGDREDREDQGESLALSDATPTLESDDDDVPDLVYNFDANVEAPMEETDDDDEEEKEDNDSIS